MTSHSTTASTTVADCPLASLPHDLQALVFDYLSGFELLVLTSVSLALHEELQCETDVWRKRLLPSSPNDTITPNTAWKDRYMAASSLRMTSTDRGAAIPLPDTYLAKWQTEAFTVDLWFCLLPSNDNNNDHSSTGGILLGAQSSPWTLDEDTTQPAYHQQLIHVDPSGNLYCSATNKKEIVAKLELHRWYHVALVHSQTLQCIFLDGAILRVNMAPMHSEWGKMKSLQFGNGFMSYGSKGRPSDHFVGWYGFNGLLDEHRVWNDTLSMGDIQRLARGESLEGNALRPVWSSTDSSGATCKRPLGNATRVRCTRPLERICGSVHAITTEPTTE